ncbi:MAG: hypothetical protein PWP65_794 [Clostridia bacterium]|nr:hypothetical protein [Clostridia bacterium]
MRKWEEKRSAEISEYILVTHIVCLLIFLMIVFSFYNLPLGLNLPLHLGLLFSLFSAGIIVYASRKLFVKIPSLGQSKADEILLLLIISPLTLTFLWYSKNFFGAKVLLIIPSIIAATAFGKPAGTIGAILASALLFFMDYKLFHRLPPEVFQSNAIMASVTILLAWLVGGLMEVERKTQQELIQLADYDQLTGLYNHRYLQEKLALSLQKAATENSPLTVVLLDIDQFKYYNTVYGYQKGDEILSAIGQLLQEEVKTPFYAARYGSDEFALIFPGKEKSEAWELAAHIREKMAGRATICLLENKMAPPFKPFSISAGSASYPADGEAALPLIRAAENDLFRTKYSQDKTYLYYSIISEISTLKAKEAFPTLRSLVALINIKDRYTFGHSERVLSYALALAEKLALSEQDRDTLRYGAYLHDLGKIEIEAAVLNKCGPLNEREWEVMKNHTIWGSEI